MKAKIILAVCMAAALITAIIVHATRDEPAPTAAPITTPATTSRAADGVPILLAITDSIALIDNNTKSSGRQYPDIVAQRMGWGAITVARGGRGYLPGTIEGATVAPFESGFASVRAAHPAADYVLIDGGRNDIGKPIDEVFAAMDEFVDMVHAAYPAAKMILTVPVYADGRAMPPDVRAIYEQWAEQVHAAANRVGAVVVDPIAEGWYQNVDLDPYLFVDGIHLNAAGQEFYAGKVIDSLQRHLGDVS